MGDYVAPLDDMRFVLRELAGVEDVARLPGYEEATGDMVEAILDEAAKFAGGVLAPLNWSGDRAGVRWDGANGGAVTMAAGFKEAYAQFAEAGWNGLSCDQDFGGQGRRVVVAAHAKAVRARAVQREQVAGLDLGQRARLDETALGLREDVAGLAQPPPDHYVLRLAGRRSLRADGDGMV